jgi:hypothetical protein
MRRITLSTSEKMRGGSPMVNTGRSTSTPRAATSSGTASPTRCIHQIVHGSSWSALYRCGVPAGMTSA